MLIALYFAPAVLADASSAHLSVALDHLVAATNHLSLSVRGLASAITKDGSTAPTASPSAGHGSGDDAVATATIAVAIVTFFVALVPLLLDWVTARREKDAVTSQMAAIRMLMVARLQILVENPLYRAAVLKEGLEDMLLRSLAPDVARVMKGAALTLLYDAFTKAVTTIVEAADQQERLSSQKTDADAQALRSEAETSIRNRATSAVQTLQALSLTKGG